MDTLKLLETGVVDLDAKIDAMEKERARLLEAICETICPLKVGEVVKCVGYTYRGKDMRITKRRVKPKWKGGWLWEVCGSILKADGSDSTNRGTFDQGQWENPRH